jgi:hypothetical protein
VRPVDRGEWPLDPGTGNPVAFAEYQDAKPHLEHRLGLYCSYCEMPILNLPAAEHLQPKGGQAGTPELERTWCNLLLACAYCNSIKRDTAIALTEFFWPDQDNTFRALAYDQRGAVRIHGDVPPQHVDRARRTLDLTGLDRAPGHPALTLKDPRWKRRQETVAKAMRSRTRLAGRDSNELREEIIENAAATGFWSVWMTVFAEDLDMRRRLIAAFPGTSRACFDDQSRPVPRPGGAL